MIQVLIFVISINWVWVCFSRLSSCAVFA